MAWNYDDLKRNFIETLTHDKDALDIISKEIKKMLELEKRNSNPEENNELKEIIINSMDDENLENYLNKYGKPIIGHPWDNPCPIINVKVYKNYIDADNIVSVMVNMAARDYRLTDSILEVDRNDKRFYHIAFAKRNYNEKKEEE